VLTVEPGHEKDAVDAELPFLGEHDLGFLPEGRGVSMGFSGLASFDELPGLGEEAADDADADGDAGSDPEDGLPAVVGTADTEIGACGAHVAEGIPLLEDTRHQTAGIGGAVLERHGDGVAVASVCQQAMM
jgi:hypothetical protein